jgi:arylsulfatase A-like enzyme
MRGRPFRAAILFGVLACAAAVAFLHSCSSGTLRPNIVLIVWDTCRGDRVTVNGYPRPTTPRLQELAAEGTTFRRCFTASPWTPPSHASLFTGLLPRHHGLREGIGDHVRPGIPLLAETLRDAGYETVCAVASPQISSVTGLDAGFDPAIHCWGPEEEKAEGAEVRRRIESWLAQRRAAGGGRKPLFLFVNLMDAHLPYAFEAASVAAVRGDGAVNGARQAAAAVTDGAANAHLYGVKVLDDRTLRDLDACYDGAVRVADRVTGEILDLLRKEGLLEGALVAVCADHGENLGEHGEVSHIMSIHEPVLHVPLVLRWPGRFEGGRVEDSEVRLHDLYPTILDAARTAAPPPCGVDAVPLTESPLRPRTLVAEYGPPLDHLPLVAKVLPQASVDNLERLHLALLAVREPATAPGARKFISYTRHGPTGPPEPVREELFDLVTDPGETRNLLLPGAPPAEAAAADRLRGVGLAGR